MRNRFRFNKKLFDIWMLGRLLGHGGNMKFDAKGNTEVLSRKTEHKL